MPFTSSSSPSNFADWISRDVPRLNAGYPPAWTGPVAAYRPSGAKLAVVLHVYYAELVDELIAALSALPIPFDLIMTNSSGARVDVDASRLTRLGSMIVLDIENRGRDIYPLVAVVNAGLLDDYDLVLKAHTKRSAWREEHAELGGTGEEWRGDLLRQVLGHPERILSAFASDPALGLVTAGGNMLGPEFWGGDLAIARDLLRRIEFDFDPESLRFPSGSMYWLRSFVVLGLRSLNLSAADFEAESGQVDGTTAHAIERIIGIVSREAGYAMRETPVDDGAEPDGWKRYLPDRTPIPRARVVPFYLPQFHTFPENDAWWGKGFTEWSNVAAAKPLFAGHAQPLLPSDLGFYDLSHPEARRDQYDLAFGAGLAGFMYYYYWFAGKKLMDMPVEQLVASNDPHPFCLMWANENWTRTWDGSAHNVLIGQDYERVPATQFIDDVMHLITDDRYLTIAGKPVIAVYKLAQIPNYRSVLIAWRDAALRMGLPGLTILSVDVGAVMDGVYGDPAEHGFDAYMEFAPHNLRWDLQSREGLPVHHRFAGDILSYSALAEVGENRLLDLGQDRYPGVMVSFDNSARRQWTPHIWYGSNPYTFRRWLGAAVSAVADRPFDERVVFLNAWNEWAESAVLEPTQRYGRSYLHAVRSVIHG